MQMALANTFFTVVPTQAEALNHCQVLLQAKFYMLHVVSVQLHFTFLCA